MRLVERALACASVIGVLALGGCRSEIKNIYSGKHKDCTYEVKKGRYHTPFGITRTTYTTEKDCPEGGVWYKAKTHAEACSKIPEELQDDCLRSYDPPFKDSE